MKRISIWLIALLIIAVPSVIYLFRPGFFVSDDGNWMIIRFSAFYQALHDGQIPVRVLGRLNFGYGYPVANFLYPGFMYLGVPLKILGFGFIDTIKILFGSSIILSGVFVFYWLRKMFGNMASFIAAIYYMYAPYHLYDLYVRGSLGEVLALAVAPFVFWQIERRSVFWVAIGIGLLLISHNTLALIFFGLIFLYTCLSIYVSKNKKILAKDFIVATAAGIGLSAFFTIPAVLELQNVVFSSIAISNPDKYFANINLVVVEILVVCVAIALLIHRKLYVKHRLTVLIAIVSVVTIFLSTQASITAWSFIPASFVQFPFRFLSVSIFATAFLLAFLMSLLKSEKFKLLLGLLVILITIYFSYPYVSQVKMSHENDAFYSTNEATTTVKDEYMPKWVKEKPSSHFDEKIQVVNGDAQVNSVNFDSKNINFKVSSDDISTLRINTIYYPGWTAFINNSPTEISYKNNFGVMELKVPAGNSSVNFEFQETNVRLAADTISIASLLFIIVYSVSLHFRKKQHENS